MSVNAKRYQTAYLTCNQSRLKIILHAHRMQAQAHSSQQGEMPAAPARLGLIRVLQGKLSSPSIKLQPMDSIQATVSLLCGDVRGKQRSIGSMAI